MEADPGPGGKTLASSSAGEPFKRLFQPPEGTFFRRADRVGMGRTLAILAVATALLVAGCSGAAGPGGTTPTGTATPTDGPTPTRTATTTPTPSGTAADDGAYNAFRFEAVEVSPEGIARKLATPVRGLDPRTRPLVVAALENGSATELRLSHTDGVPESPGTPDDGAFLRDGGTYYRVNATVVGQRSDRGYGFELEGPIRERHDDYGAATDEAVPVDSLTPTQRELFEYAAPPESRREGGTLYASFHYLPPENGPLDGTGWLDGEPHYVRDDGDLFRIRYEDEGRPTVTRLRIRYRLEHVATSASAFAADRLERYVTNATADAPPAPARSVLRSAVRNGTYEWEGTVRTRPEGVEAAERWVREHRPSGSFVHVRWNGTLYRIQVREVIE
jgi:hypothetical protein